MRKIQLHPSIMCYYVRELVNHKNAKTEEWALGEHPVACVMFAKDRNDDWYRGISVAPLKGDNFSYDGYRALAYKRLCLAIRSMTAALPMQSQRSAMKRFYSCHNTDAQKMNHLSEPRVQLTGFEKHIVEVMNPDTVTLSVNIPGLPEKGG